MVRENGIEKTGYKNFQLFCSYFWFRALSLFVITQSTKLNIFVHNVNVCSLLYNLLYRSFFIFNFHENSDLRKQKNGGVANNETPHGSTNGSIDRQTTHKTMHFVRDFQYCTNSSSCYLDVDASTSVLLLILSGFGGLEVACWPLVPKFAGSNPAEAFGFFRAKKSSAPFPSEGKESCLSHVVDLRHVKDPSMLRGSRGFSGKIHRLFLAQVVPPFTTRVSGGDT